jgi:isoquinoline 1-oxidoreductase beta subunit
VRERPIVIPRRTFLQALNLAASGLALGLGLPAPAGAQQKTVAAEGLTANVFVHVAADGLVTLVCHRSEMGQGIRSSLPVLIADELGADLKQVRVLQADGDKVYGDQNTDGSNSIRGIHEDMRRAGATARTMLVAAAAKKLRVPAAECRARGHEVVHERSGRALGFGELATLAARAKVPPPAEVVLRPIGELAHLGTDLPLLDGPAYVTGTAMFGADVKLPGMLTAVIARPKVVSGKVVRFDASRALAVPGVKRVIEVPAPTLPYKFQPWGGVAVLAEHTWAALQGRAALDVTWDHGEHASYDSAAYRKQLSAAVHAPGKPMRKVGDTERALAGAARVLELEYHVPHLPHLPMEPPVAVAHVSEGRCEVWAPTQHPQAARAEVARVLGLSEDRVTVHVTFLGGGFGRKSKADFCSEAAWLSREVGAPVRVQFTREDDVQHDYVNTVATNLLTAGLDASGKVVAYRLRTAFPPIATTLQLTESRPGPGELHQGVLDLALDVPNVSVEACEAPSHTRIGWLRSVYNIFQAFSFGSFVDELALLRGRDPLATWLELLGPPRKASLAELGIEALRNYGQPLDKHPVDVGRLRHVLERAATMARFAERKQDGRALGIAAHRSFLSYTGVVASVVRRPSGKLAVDEVWVAFDAGTLVNTDRVRAQLEGSVVFGTSLCLFGGITMKGGAIEQNNFRGGGRLVRMAEAPRTHLELVASTALPAGVGEPGVPPVAPAIANAVFALTGKRARELPLSRSFEV